MPKARHLLNDAELLEYSRHHVLYEIQMLLGTAALLNRAFQSPDAEVMHVFRNAVIESFGFHVRNLIDFFYPGKNAHHSDVLADDFFPERKRPANFPPLSISLARCRERANKELAHLTSERIAGAPPEKEWRYLELTAELGKVLNEFIRAASPLKLHSAVGEQVKFMTNGSQEPAHSLS